MAGRNRVAPRDGVECAPLTDREILEVLYHATGGIELGRPGRMADRRPARRVAGSRSRRRGQGRASRPL